MKAKFPRCPQGLGMDAYHHYIELGQCSRLSSGYCSEACEHLLSEIDENGCYPVEFDHVDPKSGGGSDSSYNIRPVCRSYNRFKSNKAESDYKERSYFDNEINPIILGILRPWQKELYELISSGSLSKLYNDPSLALLSTFAVLTWCVGAGKTLGWILFALAINKARGHKGVRVKRVLFLVQQRDLVANIAAELQGTKKEKSDIEKYLGISAPTVYQLTDADQWDVADCLSADIVATCPQALWGFKDDEKSRKTKNLRKQHLAKFDLIVVDEGHFAVHQYADFLADAPMAFKLIMSATPMDGSGQYLSAIPGYGDRFRYINVFADYKRVQSTGCLKVLPSWEDGTAATPKEWNPKSNDDKITYVNGPNYFCHPSTNDTFLNESGSVEIDPLSPNHAIETSIKLINKTTGYQSQLLIKAENRHIANNVVKHLNSQYGDGFASAVYTGHKAGSRLDKNHPWMTGNSTVLVAIDMAQFGLNRPECTVVCWIAKNLSYVEIIQRIGRALRIVKGVPPLDQKVKLVWSDPSMTPFIKRALEIMHDSSRNIAANFQDMAGLLEEGFKGYTALPELVSSVPGLTDIDKRQIERLVGTSPMLTPSESDYENLARVLVGADATDCAKGKMLGMVKQYADEIRQPEWIRGRIIDVDSKPLGWLRLKLTAEPDPNSITEDDLIEHIQSMRIPALDKKCLLSMLETSEEYRAEIFQRVQESRHNTFKPMVNGYHPSVIVGVKKDGEITESYRIQITKDHFKNGSKQEHIERAKAIKTALSCVLRNALAIEKFSDVNNGYKSFCPQLSTALMTERIRKIIIKMATDYCYKHYPDLFKPYPDFLEAANNATH